MQGCRLISQSKDFWGANTFSFMLEAKASGQKLVIGCDTQEQRDKLKWSLVRFSSSSCQADVCQSRGSPAEWLSPGVLALGEVTLNKCVLMETNARPHY